MSFFLFSHVQQINIPIQDSSSIALMTFSPHLLVTFFFQLVSSLRPLYGLLGTVFLISGTEEAPEEVHQVNDFAEVSLVRVISGAYTYFPGDINLGHKAACPMYTLE